MKWVIIVCVAYVAFYQRSVLNCVTASHRLYTHCIQAVYTISIMYSDDEHPCLTSLLDHPDYDDPFNPRHAEQVSRALYELLTDMSVVSGVKTYNDQTPQSLKKRSVYKGKRHHP